jgi:hypothetical protein
MKTSSRRKAQRSVEALKQNLVPDSNAASRKPYDKSVCPSCREREVLRRCGAGRPPCCAVCAEEHRRESKERYRRSKHGKALNARDSFNLRCRRRADVLLSCPPPRGSMVPSDELGSRLQAIKASIAASGVTTSARFAAEALQREIDIRVAEDASNRHLQMQCMEVRVDLGAPAPRLSELFHMLRLLGIYYGCQRDDAKLGRTFTIRANLQRIALSHDTAWEGFARAYRILANTPHPSRESRLWQHRALLLGARTVGFHIGDFATAEPYLRELIKVTEKIDSGGEWLETHREILGFRAARARKGDFAVAERSLEEVQTLSRRFDGHLFDPLHRRSEIEFAFSQGHLQAAETAVKKFEETAWTLGSARHALVGRTFRARLEGRPQPSATVSEELSYIPICYIYNDKGQLEYI